MTHLVLNCALSFVLLAVSNVNSYRSQYRVVYHYDRPGSDGYGLGRSGSNSYGSSSYGADSYGSRGSSYGGGYGGKYSGAYGDRSSGDYSNGYNSGGSSRCDPWDCADCVTADFTSQNCCTGKDYTCDLCKIKVLDKYPQCPMAKSMLKTLKRRYGLA